LTKTDSFEGDFRPELGKRLGKGYEKKKNLEKRSPERKFLLKKLEGKSESYLEKSLTRGKN